MTQDWRPKQRYWICLMLAITLCFWSAGISKAQSSQSGKTIVEGRIVDATALAVPKATVILNNELTGASESLTTTDQGRFAFSAVETGTYSLTAKAQGFADRSSRITVESGQSIQLGDLAMSVIGINQSVTVVSASRVEELQQDSPVNTLVVGKQEIQNTGYERVGDVLSEIPGIVTRAQSYGVPLPGGEQINGVDSRQVLVLQDGLPIVGARGITEGTIDLNQQEVGRLDRVEVVEGAASALYGSDAIGGVVNLIASSRKIRSISTLRFRVDRWARSTPVSTSAPNGRISRRLWPSEITGSIPIRCSRMIPVQLARTRIVRILQPNFAMRSVPARRSASAHRRITLTIWG